MKVLDHISKVLQTLKFIRNYSGVLIVNSKFKTFIGRMR